MCKRWRGDELTAENEKWGAKGKKKRNQEKKEQGRMKIRNISVKDDLGRSLKDGN